MGYYLTEEEKQKDKNNQPDAPINTSGIVGGSADPTSTTPKADDPNKPGSGFVNLQQYLTSNVGKGAGLADASAKGVTDSVSGIKTEADSAQKDLANTKKSFIDSGENIKNSLGVDAAGNQGAATDFLGKKQSSSVLDTLGGKKKIVEDDVNKLDDSAQISANLQNQFKGNNDYSKGFGLLDTFLLQGDASGRDKLSEIKKNSQNDLNSAYDTTKSALTDTQTTLANSQQSIKDAAKSYKSGIVGAAAEKAKNIGLDKKSNIGWKAADVGDALNEKNMLDLNALSDLAGESRGNYAKSFAEGYAPPPPPPPPPVVPETPAAPNPDLTSITAAPILNQVTPGGTHFLNQVADTFATGGGNITAQQAGNLAKDTVNQSVDLGRVAVQNDPFTPAAISNVISPAINKLKIPKKIKW
jgi:hypothetical protein